MTIKSDLDLFTETLARGESLASTDLVTEAVDTIALYLAETDKPAAEDWISEAAFYATIGKQITTAITEALEGNRDDYEETIAGEPDQGEVNAEWNRDADKAGVSH